MIKKSYSKATGWIERHRFKLLILATVLVLILPAFAGNGPFGNILFVVSMSFLFIQSMIVASTKKGKGIILRYIIVIIMIILFSLDPFGIISNVLELIRLLLLATFFIFVTYYLVLFMKKSSTVNINVIITAINIYLLLGIISSSLAFVCYKIFPDSYLLPANITEPTFVTFLYYSFITMSTVGYGDITPRIAETQTLAYLTAISGQLYVAIIIAFLVGKLLMHPVEDKK
jgi:voltage-gated potassium channel